MQLADAEKLALELMGQFGLLPRWKFEFDDAVRRFGCCHRKGLYRFGSTDELAAGGKITLSRALVLRNERADVEDTIRHEIAHALCPPKAGHGPLWKSMCKRTGAKPERCYDHEEVDAPEGDWSATCGVCGVVHYKFRRPKRELWCGRKECKAMMVPYIPGLNGGLHPLRKLVFKHKNAIDLTPAPTPSAAERRAAIEAMKAQLRTAEQEPGVVVKPDFVSEASKVSTERSMMQCVKCDAKSLGSEKCPGCGGALKPSWLLEAEKATLKRRIAELEKRAGK
jgi:hypothetical protein